jgi:thiol-disulfide isomerase/thioredoxin
MSNRADRDRRRRERLEKEQAEAARAARRKDLAWYGAIVAVLAAAAIVLVIGLSGRGDDSAGAVLKPASANPPAAAARSSERVPRQIAVNLRDGDKVVDGRVRERLARLRGVPVVVNMWASWCPNCRAEFPFFQQLSRTYERRVAFLGLDSQDERGAAEAFLRQYPVNYPSVFDQSAGQALAIGAGRGWPTTLYYDRTGRQTFVHEGGYTSLAALDADVRRYALGV